MRRVILALIGIAACGSDDRSAPVLVDVVAVPGVHLGVADASSPLSGPMRETTTRPTIALSFSERLDGDAVEEVVNDPETNTVRELVGRDGVIRIAPLDGSVIGESIAYHPAERAIYVFPSAHLPADTTVLLHLMAERIWDPAGNVVPPARTANGDPVVDVDGRVIAATVAFVTEPIAFLGADVPAYGTTDDPDTAPDESVSYTAPMTLHFNTAIAPATVNVSLSAQGGAPAAALVASTGDSLTAIHLTPLEPLNPESHYELRINRARDLYGIRWNESPQLVIFSTR